MKEVERVFAKSMFPDRLELRVNSDGTKELAFVFVRNIARMLDQPRTDCAHALQDAGFTVVVSVMGQHEITLEQFETEGVYGFKQSKTVQSRQGLYNKVSELRLLEQELELMSKEDPRYYTKSVRVHHLRSMLETALPHATREQIAQSDERLRKLEQLLKEAEEQPNATREPSNAGENNATTQDGERVVELPASSD